MASAQNLQDVKHEFPPSIIPDVSLSEIPTHPALAVLSRIEFESNNGDNGTKVLMVEWDVSLFQELGVLPAVKDIYTGDLTERQWIIKRVNDWEVSWQGTSAVLGTTDRVAKARKRVYFLLPPKASIPEVIRITHCTGRVLTTRPLPAIFPEEFRMQNGRNGVYHTAWARNRLADLDEEICAEMRENTEGVGLEIALQEKQWLLEHFSVGVDYDTPSLALKSVVPSNVVKIQPARRLVDHRQGLRLATSPEDLGLALNTRNKPALITSCWDSAAEQVFVEPYTTGGSTPAQVNSTAPDKVPGSRNMRSKQSTGNGNEEELFALPISPRSPEMERSPFSLL